MLENLSGTVVRINWAHINFRKRIWLRSRNLVLLADFSSALLLLQWLWIFLRWVFLVLAFGLYFGFWFFWIFLIFIFILCSLAFLIRALRQVLFSLSPLFWIRLRLGLGLILRLALVRWFANRLDQGRLFWIFLFLFFLLSGFLSYCLGDMDFFGVILLAHDFFEVDNLPRFRIDYFFFRWAQIIVRIIFLLVFREVARIVKLLLFGFVIKVIIFFLVS